VQEKRVIDVLQLFEICLRKSIKTEDQNDTTEWLALVQQLEQKVDESRILLSDLKRVLEDNGVVVGPAIYEQLSAFFDLERDDRIYFSSVLEYLSNPSLTKLNFFKICPKVLAQQSQDFIKNCILEIGIEQLELAVSEALSKLYPELDLLLHSQAGPVPLLDMDKVESPSKALGSSQRQRHKRKQHEEARAKEERDRQERDRRDTEQQQLKAKKLGGVLLKENVTFDLFQKIIENKSGAVLSSWEVFNFFEMLNVVYAKMFYEPKRCQEV